jgi:hypothetical protein
MEETTELSDRGVLRTNSGGGARLGESIAPDGIAPSDGSAPENGNGLGGTAFLVKPFPRKCQARRNSNPHGVRSPLPVAHDAGEVRDGRCRA